jgi:predicted nucleotidyltransferase
MKSDPLTARIAQAQLAARARASSLLAAVDGVAAELSRRGATRVRLFGSLATGKEPHAGTDIDLCVWGLTDSALFDAAVAFQDRALPVQLVRGETAAPRLLLRVERDGIEVILGS